MDQNPAYNALREGGGDTHMVELYDLAGAGDLRFSPYCFRAKAVLAYKGIPYRTIPVRFTEKDKIAFSGQDRVPVIRDGDAVRHDSWTIAGYLEQKQPAPSIFPGPGLKEACRFFNLYVDRTVHGALFPVVVWDIFTHIEAVDRDYFRRTREERLGATLETVASRRDQYRAQMRATLADLEAAVSGQQYFFGLLTYADLCLLGTLSWVRAVSEEPVLDPFPALRQWWERLREQIRL